MARKKNASRKRRGGAGQLFRKTHQLCHQVAETLGFVFSDGTFEDLLGLYVVSVVPAPNASRLLVSVAALDQTEELNAPLVYEQLNGHVDQLRYEVASAINRKKTPSLVFQIVHPEDEAEGG